MTIWFPSRQKREPPKPPPPPLQHEPVLDERMAPLLAELPPGSNVAVVTLLGSLCPITLGHVAAFVEARKLLLDEASPHRPKRLERFAHVLGFISLNGDYHVGMKMAQAGQPFLDADQRQALVKLAVADMQWMGWEAREGVSIRGLRRRWPNITFVHFTMNGADDVAKYRKYLHAEPRNRYITMGRPGETEKVVKGMQAAGVDPEDGNCLLGPELPDISSTEARHAIAAGDEAALARLLHPRVAEWCLRHSPWCRRVDLDGHECAAAGGDGPGDAEGVAHDSRGLPSAASVMSESRAMTDDDMNQAFEELENEEEDAEGGGGGDAT